MAEPRQFEVIRIPNTLNAEDREQLGNEIVRFIIDRTRKGLDKNNVPFRGYSENYKDHIDFQNAGKSNRVNLTLTGEMLNTLEVQAHGPGFIRIGFSDTDSNDKAFYSREKGRDFLGISAKDLQLLLTKFLDRTPQQREQQQIISSVAEAFLRDLLNGE